MNAEDRATNTAYSDWGGVPIQSIVAEFLPGFPVPEERGLIHKTCTPTKVAREAAPVIRVLLP